LSALVAFNVIFALLQLRPAYSQNIEVLVRDANGAPAFNAVVYAYPADGNVPGWSPKTVIVDQIDKEFTPSVTIVPVGTPIFFPNDDDIRHHVYSFSQAKMFELPLYSGKQAKPVVFDKPGVVALGCNIHDWMVAYIYVSDTPYYAKTGKDGKTRLENLEPGRYNFFVWHPWMKGKPEDYRKFATVGGDSRVEFDVKLRANLHIRRAPAIGGGGY
jgi:plastocyanin